MFQRVKTLTLIELFEVKFRGFPVKNFAVFAPDQGGWSSRFFFFGTLEGLAISFNFVERSYGVGRVKTNIGT